MLGLNYGLFLKRKLSSLSLVVLTHCCRGSSVPLKSGRDAGADIFTPPSCCAYCSVVGLGSGLAGGFVLVIAALIVWKWKKSNILSCIFSAKRKGSAVKEAQLRKESQKIQEELDYWGAFLSQLLELTSGLGKQKEEFRLQLEEIQKEREGNKDKLNVVEKEREQSEKEKATDLREKHLLNAQRKLDIRKEKLEKQQLDVERLLQKTEALMAKVTERKTKAENHMQVIQLQLQELESDDDEAHLHRE